MIRLLQGLLFGLLMGCTTIGHAPPPAGWPQLKIIEHYVTARQMADVCGKYSAWYMTTLACAEIDLDKNTCELWFSEEFAPAWITEHERLHCEGRDHPGGTLMQDLLDKKGKT